MNFFKKKLSFIMVFVFLFLTNTVTVFADTNTNPPSQPTNNLQNGMTDEQKALQDANQKIFNNIKGSVDSQNAKINEQVQNQKQATSYEKIHKEREQIKNISNIIIIAAPTLGLGIIIAVSIIIIKLVTKQKNSK